MTEPTALRTHLVDALYADLVGPFEGDAHHHTATELLTQRPSRWYLTGFLVPEAGRETEPDVLDGAGEGDDVTADDANSEEAEAKRVRLFPASMGLSVLVPADAKQIEATVSFAHYSEERIKTPGKRGPGKKAWRRVPQPERTITIPLEPDTIAEGIPHPDIPGIKLEGRLARFSKPLGSLPKGTQALSLFLVNKQPLSDDKERELKTIFQVQLALCCEAGFCPRPNRIGAVQPHDLDGATLDLQYRDKVEYAVGHNVAAEPDPHALRVDNHVVAVRTRWIPRFEVPVVAAREPELVVTTEMAALGKLQSASDVATALDNLPAAYREWLAKQAARKLVSGDDELDTLRKETQDHLLKEANAACDRIQAGIHLLKESDEIRHAFRLANQAMAAAARKRDPNREPAWRLFQLAFLLLNLHGLSNAEHADRRLVELIFFPTGGGKTEAYLGCIAFSLLLRRMRGQGTTHEGLGVAVILRYTLRLLTLDQLERATILICSLELLRRAQPELLGTTRYSIGLWVGSSTTANRFKEFSEAKEEYRNGRAGSPCPLEKCPWCQEPLSAAGMTERPNKKKCERIELLCMNHGNCDFANPNPDGLPVAFVDEQIYRELPSFIIATVDKFAMMPWRGETAMLFGHVTHRHQGRFFSPLDKPPRGAEQLYDGLLPPEVVVQDELHLITGPLGTMVGLYEIALDQLASCDDEHLGRRTPKVIASTATANRARQQIQSLYGRQTRIFPPPALDALETYFSFVDQSVPGRLYIGVAAPGHPIKRILLRTYIALLCAAKKAESDERYPDGLADAYLTLVGYFNALRELGGMRRLVEDDVRQQAGERSKRVPAGGLELNPWMVDRPIAEPLELTSRVPTGKITETKARLAEPHAKDRTTDVVLASNMISVGVDITRLGLMVVAGQPKTTSEYIQASSRVGRDKSKPGLVVTCFNVARPRDRSHYEHFVPYHESFYRFVEAQSVTPFATRALERGLTGAMVAAVRLSDDHLVPPDGATKIAAHRKHADRMVQAFVSAAEQRNQGTGVEPSLVSQWANNRLDIWERIVSQSESMRLTYSRYDVDKGDRTLLHLSLDPPEDPTAGEEKFSAPTSMRDVEPSVHLWLAQPGKAKKESR